MANRRDPINNNEVMVARTLTRPHGQSVVIWIVNTDVSMYKHSKIAKAEMISNSEICSTCKQAETASKLDLSMKDIPLLLPDDIASAQKDHKGLATCNTNTWL